MRLINLTRRNEIGANSYCLDVGGKRVILDAGLHPKKIGDEALPDYRLIADNSVDTIIITHAHQDHVGSLPVLLRRQPRARVLLTSATAELTRVMLHNSVSVMTRQRAAQGISQYPLFTHRETDDAGSTWQEVNVGQRCNASGERVGFNDAATLTIEFFESGHIIGASGVLIRAEGKRIFYTGDVNFADQTMSRKANFPEESLDVLITETTRGDRSLPPDFTRAGEEARLLSEIHDAFRQGGSVLMPVFALGKTQEILSLIHRFRTQGALQGVPVYIGGLSTKVTNVHDRLAASVRRQNEGLQLMASVERLVLKGSDIATTQINRSRLYVLSSGMMTEKTLSNQLAARFLENRQQSIFFVGYADPDSPAGKIKAAQPGDFIPLVSDGPPRKMLCRVREFDFSAHAERSSILAYIRQTEPKNLFLVHGDGPSLAWFSNECRRHLEKTAVVVPLPGESYEVN